MAPVASAPVARPTKKLRGDSLHQVHVMLSAELLAAVDRVAKDLDAQAHAPSRHTRTDALRTLLVEALRARGILK